MGRPRAGLLRRFAAWGLMEGRGAALERPRIGHRAAVGRPGVARGLASLVD